MFQDFYNLATTALELCSGVNTKMPGSEQKKVTRQEVEDSLDRYLVKASKNKENYFIIKARIAGCTIGVYGGRWYHFRTLLAELKANEACVTDSFDEVKETSYALTKKDPVVFDWS